MEVQGKIIAVLPTRSGTSSTGTQWSSQTAVIETQEQYPKRLAFDIMNDKIGQFNVQVGELMTVSFDIDAHEYNGRWFNSCRAWNVTRQQQQQYQQQPIQQQPQQYGQQPQQQAPQQPYQQPYQQPHQSQLPF